MQKTSKKHQKNKKIARLTTFVPKSIRACSIYKKKKRVRDDDGHEVDEATAEGGIRIKSKYYDTSNF